MQKKDILVEHRVDQSHYNALRVYYMYRRATGRTKFMVSILLTSLILLILSETAYSFPFFKFIGLFGMLILVAMYSWISIDARKLEKYAQDIVNKKQGVTLTQEGFTATWKGLNAEEKYKWAEIDYVYEDDSYFFLFIDRYSVIILAKLELKDPIVKEIRALIENNTNYVSDVTGFKHRKI